MDAIRRCFSCCAKKDDEVPDIVAKSEDVVADVKAEEIVAEVNAATLADAKETPVENKPPTTE